MSDHLAARRRLARLCLALLATYGLLLSTTSGVAWAAVPPTQLVPDSVDLPDPTVVDLNGHFWAYGTDGARSGARIPMYRADDVTGPYTFMGKALPTIPWARADTNVFAPDVRHTGGSRVLLYFSATPSWYPPGDNRKCIGAAVSNNGPGGPFVAQENPLRCAPRRGGVIDPAYFRDQSTGQTYIVYKTNHALDRPDDPLRQLWAQRIGDDGLGPVAGAEIFLAGSRTNIENPHLMYKQGKYVLFHSRELYRTYQYRTSVLTASSLGGPYTNLRHVITTENSKAAGPGGADIVFVEENNVGWVAFFHGWIKEGANCYVRRPMWVAQLTFGADGLTPSLAQPGSGTTPTCP